jgi:hypothetical protein
MKVEQTIPEKIKQRRSQMLVHSCAYYELDNSMVDDHTWQRWADDLTALQNKYPEHCKIKFYDKAFEGWNGSSGYDLPLKDGWVWNKTHYLLKINENNALHKPNDVLEYTGNLEDFM